MKIANGPTQKQLRELFDYDSKTGNLLWKHRPQHHFKSSGMCAKWNAKFPGNEAGWISHKGYRNITLAYKTHQAHRLIFLREFGYLPPQIDHINGDKSDNRIENLRAADHSANMKNKTTPKSNKSGRIGVGTYKGKWHASIRVDRKSIHLGYFSDFQSACAARSAAEIKYGFHTNHGRTS